MKSLLTLVAAAALGLCSVALPSAASAADSVALSLPDRTPHLERSSDAIPTAELQLRPSTAFNETQARIQLKAGRQMAGIGVAWTVCGPLLVGLGVIGLPWGIPSIALGAVWTVVGPLAIVAGAIQVAKAKRSLRDHGYDPRGRARAVAPLRSRHHGFRFAAAPEPARTLR